MGVTEGPDTAAGSAGSPIGEDARGALRRAALGRLPERRRVALGLDGLAQEAGVEQGLAHEEFPGEWDLLSDLVLGAYNAMSDAAEAGAERARAEGVGLLGRWTAICLGVRRWALDHPDEYTLIWGSPVPGYVAPPETMVAGARTVLALLGTLREAQETGVLDTYAGDPEPSEGMRRNIAPLAEGLLSGLPDQTIARLLTAWTQLHGMVGFEVNGHIAGVAADPEAFFAHTAESMGVFMGLPRG
ncbi:MULTISPECIES: TetR-like C-terminal domain-containing protein [unclassified Streptomyces]|uniref:TetR-like C-terminal domain-containing protein n=1 Tax=unclassified Streptomyces TaxID=2593676 RepID=UPI0020240D97|nr:TetR-like C-terminal domain-containing protein [Streptomyces sp. A 4/2]